MDATTLTALAKELSDANSSGNTEDVVLILTRLKLEVKPTEELLRTTRTGVAVGKLRNHSTPGISVLAKEVVKLWKDAIEDSKKKRKRDDDGDVSGIVKKEDGGAKRVKAEGSATASPSAATPPVASTSTSTPEVDEIDSKPVKSESSPSQQPDSPTREPLSTIDSSRTIPRTAKADGVALSLRAESREHGGAADSVRDKCVVMIYDSLAGDSTAETRILSERAIAIERAVYKLMKSSTGNEYRGKIRSLFLNLKDKGNPGLRNEIVVGHISADRVVNMTKEDMASEEVKTMNEKIANDNLFKAKAVGETLAETDAFKCSRCQQRKCTYYQMQTRSADEPMTTFVNCTNCGNRWKFS